MEKNRFSIEKIRVRLDLVKRQKIKELAQKILEIIATIDKKKRTNLDRLVQEIEQKMGLIKREDIYVALAYIISNLYPGLGLYLSISSNGGMEIAVNSAELLEEL